MSAHHRRRRALVALLVGVATAASAVGCASDPAPTAPPVAARRVVPAEEAAADGVFVIGAVLARTGVLAAEEADVIAALDAAVAHQNARGGIGGQPVELRVADSESSMVVATRVATELSEGGADALVVGCDIDVAATAARVARRTSRLALSTCAGDDEFGVDTASNATFDFAPSTAALARALADRVLAAGLRSAITVSDLVPYESSGACQDFAAAYRAAGGTIVTEVEIDNGDQLSTTADRITRVGATGVLVSCLGRAGVAPVLRAVRDAGVATPIVGLGGVDAPPWPGGTVDGVTFPTVADLWAGDPALAPLVAAGATNGRAIVTFVALDVLARAVAAAPDARAASVADALRATPWPTPIGTLTFDARQRATGHTLVFVTTEQAGARRAP